MKIVIISDSMMIPSGFGQQTKLLADGLASKGATVIVLSGSWEKRPDCPANVSEWHLAKITDLDAIDRVLHKISPDAVICLSHTAMISHLTALRSAPANCQIYYWFPWEGGTVPRGADTWFTGVPSHTVIHLSNVAQQMWHKILPHAKAIPHMVDKKEFPYKNWTARSNARPALLKKYSKLFNFQLDPDAIILLNVDRNIKHKRWDATFSLVKELEAQSDKKVQLIAHTQINNDPTENSIIPGYDLKRLEQEYKTGGQVCYTGFTWKTPFSKQQLNDLYTLCDYRISTSEGEGFGIPTVECGFSGTPQVINGYRVAEELTAGKFLTQPAFYEFDRDSLWAVPNVVAMTAMIMKLENNPTDRAEMVRNLEYYQDHLFSADIIIDKWWKLLNSTKLPPAHFQEHYFHGFRRDVELTLSLRDAAIAAGKLVGNGKILEVGSHKGQFLDYCIEAGLDVTGIEPAEQFINQMSSRAKLYLRENSNFGYVQADLVVITRALERVISYEDNDVATFLENISHFPWVFFNNDPVYCWNTPQLNSELVTKHLEKLGMVRRIDIEEMLKKDHKLANFRHEVWSNNKDTSYMPRSLLMS